MIRVLAVAVLAVISFHVWRLYLQARQEELIVAEIEETVNELRKTVLALVEAGKIAAPR